MNEIRTAARAVIELFSLWIVLAVIGLLFCWLVVPSMFDAPVDDRPATVQPTSVRPA
ncbi:hypothetical protein [Burkholderia gladioli]|uniref:hypothetical protein n=1 Tax=Burkholderia gladioli TaxID=28095 RepID=UPI00164083F0|nr:hypothetical protein [Burkholderia gladioli]